MMDEIRIRTAPGTWVVRAGGAVLGETRAALELTEGGREPVIYFPPADIAMAFLERSERRAACPRKGEATFWSIVTKSTTLQDAAWSYEAPSTAAAALAGHIAFDPERATVEQL